MSEDTASGESVTVDGQQSLRRQVKIILRMLESLDNELARLQSMARGSSDVVPAIVKKNSQKHYKRTLAKIFGGSQWLTFN